MNEDGQQTCFCCGRRGKPSLCIVGHFLCHDCEDLLVRAMPGDADYDHLVERCRAIWAEPDEGGGEECTQR